MSDEALRATNRQASQFASTASEPASLAAGDRAVLPDASVRRHRLFWVATCVVNFLLLAALSAMVYTAVWEYSTT